MISFTKALLLDELRSPLCVILRVSSGLIIILQATVHRKKLYCFTWNLKTCSRLNFLDVKYLDIKYLGQIRTLRISLSCQGFLTNFRRSISDLMVLI